MMIQILWKTIQVYHFYKQKMVKYQQFHLIWPHDAPGWKQCFPDRPGCLLLYKDHSTQCFYYYLMLATLNSINN